MSTIQKIRKGAKALDDLSAAIRNPEAQGAVGRAIGEAGQRFCRAFSAGEALRDGDIPTAQLPLVGLGRATAALVCKPYLEDNNWDLPGDVPLYTGGQCSGVSYTITADFLNFFTGCASSVSNFGPNIRTGPIGGLVPIAGSFSCGPEGATAAGWQIETGSGLTGMTGSSPRGKGTPYNIVVTRNDGLPDDCGDGPGEFGPGNNPAPSPGPFPTGEDPSIDPTGQPFFFVPPIETPFGDIEVPDDFFGGPGETGGGDGLPGLGDAIGAEAGDIQPGDGEEIDFGEPPEGRVWVGCIVETTTDSRIGSIAGTGPGQRVWPSVRGNLSLNYGSKKGSNVRITSRFTEVYRPVTSLILTGAFLQMQPFSSGKVFPVSALKCPDNPCGDS